MDTDCDTTPRSRGGPRSARLAALACLGLLTTATTGCGFFLVHGPPAAHESLTAFSCTRANAGPIVDAALAGTALLVGAQLLAADRSDNGGWTAPYVVVGAGLALEGVVFGASAVAGFEKTSRCRRALRQLAERGAGTAAAAPRR